MACFCPRHGCAAPSSTFEHSCASGPTLITKLLPQDDLRYNYVQFCGVRLNSVTYIMYKRWGPAPSPSSRHLCAPVLAPNTTLTPYGGSTHSQLPICGAIPNFMKYPLHAPQFRFAPGLDCGLTGVQLGLTPQQVGRLRCRKL